MNGVGTYSCVKILLTKRSREDILANTLVTEDRPLRMATKNAAWRDLKRVGRNTEMVNVEEIERD